MVITTNNRPRRPSVTFVSGSAPALPHPPAPILKNGGMSLVDGGNNNNRKRPVEFSSDISVIHNTKAENGLDESDTDIGSYDFDAEGDSFDFGVGEDDDDGMTTVAIPPLPSPPAITVTKDIRGGERNSKMRMVSTSSSPFISRVGAKIRRLNLNEGDEADGGGTSSSSGKIYSRSNFAKKKVGALGPVFAVVSSSSSAATTLVDSPSKKASSSTIGINSRNDIHLGKATAQSQSPDGSCRNRSLSTMPLRTLCPPSSVEGSGRRRCLFASETQHEENGLFVAAEHVDISSGNTDEVRDRKEKTINYCDVDDVSPRDVTNFPSFSTWDSPTKVKVTGASCGEGRKDLDATRCSPPPSTSTRRYHPHKLSPPPPTPSMENKSKPHHRRFLESITSETIQDSIAVCNTTANYDGDDANEIDHFSLPSLRAPRQGLRTYGRANSFLQMFSQESLIINENDVNATESMEEEEDFIKKPKDQTAEFSMSPPRCNRHNHRRYTPTSPSSINDNESLDGTGTKSSSSFSRFLSDFEIVGTLGVGSFGSVYSVRNRTDQRLYAIKAARREARGSSDRDRMLQEVYALSALSDKGCMNSMHIVRYHQAWMEGNRLYIQTELCDSTLLEVMRDKRNDENNDGKPCVYLDEKQRYKLLREMLLALDLVHKSGMIHLDIKPENIFIKNGQYKLGDFGLVSKIENHDDVEEGDSRYMSMELLSGDLDDLTKSDIFSLGATLYEICLGRAQTLPENGSEWQDMRQGILLPMPNTTFELQMIIREMMMPECRSRPSAEKLLKRRQLLSDEQKELIVERNKATAANLALDVQMQRLKALSPQNSRKLHRSNTIC